MRTAVTTEDHGFEVVELPDPTPEADQLVPTTIEPVTALLREVTIRYSVAYSIDEFREVIDAFSTCAIDPTPTVGPTFALSQIAEAFDAVRDGRVQGRVSVRP
jgi:(R,R)-butanediol dehydrogenase / meso-butanediol dehydrogenase / diacetyl reductase